jgi:hypothetical protein
MHFWKRNAPEVPPCALYVEKLRNALEVKLFLAVLASWEFWLLEAL